MALPKECGPLVPEDILHVENRLLQGGHDIVFKDVAIETRFFLVRRIVEQSCHLFAGKKGKTETEN